MNDETFGAYVRSICNRSLLGEEELIVICNLFASASVKGFSPELVLKTGLPFAELYERMRDGLNNSAFILQQIDEITEGLQ